jgi:hypothetical protein
MNENTNLLLGLIACILCPPLIFLFGFIELMKMIDEKHGNRG